MGLEDLQFLRNRRRFFSDCGIGLGTIALWHLLSSEGDAAPSR